MLEREYLVPVFQRKYSWDITTCDQLWQDMLAAYKDDPEEVYFLGSIVIAPTSDGRMVIIDGQQRLITLTLLLRVLFLRDRSNKELRRRFVVIDDATGDPTKKPRITSDVIGTDDEQLKRAVTASYDELAKESGSLFKNMNHLHKCVNDWEKSLEDAKRDFDGPNGELRKFIRYILGKVEFLPIECPAEEKGLDIFMTINDRGMRLEDSDIFKTRIYGNLEPDRRDAFIEDWNNLKDPMRAFTFYMRILRAKVGDVELTNKALRKFFTEKPPSGDGSDRLANSEKVVRDIERINDLLNWLDDGNKYAVPKLWWRVLEAYSNDYGQYPIVCFLYRYGKLGADDELTLTAEQHADLEELMEWTAKYYLFKGVVNNTSDSVKSVTYRACREILAENPGDPINEFKQGIPLDDRKIFKERIEDGVYGPRHQRGLVLLGALLNPNQDKHGFFEFLTGKVEIEHIFPKGWKDSGYGGWTPERRSEDLEMLGNLVPLARKINRRVGDKFFGDKKVFYKDSQVQDAGDLAKESSDQWTHAMFMKRNGEIAARLLKFFGWEHEDL